MSWNDPARRDLEKRLSEVPGDPTPPPGLLQALKDDVPADLSAAPVSKVPPPAPPWWRAHGLRVAAMLLLVVGAGLATLVLWPRVEAPEPRAAGAPFEDREEASEATDGDVEERESSDDTAAGEAGDPAESLRALGYIDASKDEPPPQPRPVPPSRRPEPRPQASPSPAPTRPGVRRETRTESRVETRDETLEMSEVAAESAPASAPPPAPPPPPPAPTRVPDPEPVMARRKLAPQATVEDEIQVTGRAAAPSVTSATVGEAEERVQNGGGFVREVSDRPFVVTQGDRFAVFGLGVDRGSWELTRELVRAGRLPDPDLVRLEEWLRVLDTADPAPAPGSSAAFAFAFEGVPSPFGGSWAPLGDDAGHRYFLRLGLRAREGVGGRRPVARDAHARITWNPAAVVGYRLLGYEEAPREEGLERAEGVDVQGGTALSVLYEVILAPTVPAGRVLGVWTVPYRDPLTGEEREENRLLKSDELTRGWDDAPAEIRFAAEVAEATHLMRRRPVPARRLQAVARRMGDLAAESFPGDGTRAEMAEVTARAAEIAARSR